MGKFVLLVVFAALVYWIFRNRNRPTGEPRSSSSKAEEAMVICAHCGVYLPISDSIGDEGARYCSQAHQSAGPRQGS